MSYNYDTCCVCRMKLEGNEIECGLCGYDFCGEDCGYKNHELGMYVCVNCDEELSDNK